MEDTEWRDLLTKSHEGSLSESEGVQLERELRARALAAVPHPKRRGRTRPFQIINGEIVAL